MGPAHIIEKMALIQDYYYVCPNTPLQYAGIKALSVADSYYDNLRSMFLQKRALTTKALHGMGFGFLEPQGAYYVLADCGHLNKKNSQQLVDELMQQANVATVSGHAFYLNKEDGDHRIRFCYALGSDILQTAYQALENNLESVKHS